MNTPKINHMKILFPILLLLSGILSVNAQDVSPEYAYNWKGEILATNAPRTEGIVHRIEVITVRHFNPNDPDLRSLTKFGKIYPERNLNTGMIRLMLGNFPKSEEAKPVLGKIKSMGFTSARIVRYKDGYREE